MAHPELTLRVAVRGRHPWFFKKMIRKPAVRIPAGSAVRVVDRDRRFVGVGFYNPHTDLALRMLAREEVDDVDAALLARLERAIAWRDEHLGLPAVTTGYRIVHAEGDGFPGFVLDRLGAAFVAQVFSLAIHDRLEPLGRRLLQRYPRARLVLTVDPDAAGREGIELPPPLVPFHVEVVERGLRYTVTPGGGHKTGFFADQRENRARVENLAKGRRVLDLFCNAGGFALGAARGGAQSVLAVDLDEAILAQARSNAASNRLPVEFVHDDAFDVLRRAPAGAYDLIVLDPPKWAAGRSGLPAALPRYQDLNRLAFEKIARGGLLLTCSCSGALSEEAFLKVLREAAAAARRDARLFALGGAGPDHPIALECPETRYLKAAFLEVG